MPRDVRYRVEVSDDEDEEVRRNIMTDGSEAADMVEHQQEDEPEKVEQPEGDSDVKKDEDEEEDEEVYEIENIIHHKKNMFGKSTGFFVKWKGYPSSDNSWVKEEDCNAPDLIRDYYAKSETKKGRGSEKPRSQRTRIEDTDMEEDVKPKKIKKKSTGKASEKASKTNGRTSLRAVDRNADTDEDVNMAVVLGANTHSQREYGSMDEYRDEEDWEHLIEEILTVDYADDNSHSVVYFLKLKSGGHAATTGDWMSRKAAKMTIRFYENNLRFKEASDEA